MPNMEEKRRDRLSELQEEICEREGVSSQTFQLLLDAVRRHSKNHQAVGDLLDELLYVLNEEIKKKEGEEAD